jgi:hypothetical protein
MIVQPSDPLHAKPSQGARHRLWPGRQHSEGAPECGYVQARWCRVWCHASVGDR